MCFYDSSAFPGPSIFDAPTDDPKMAVSLALEDMADAAARYCANGDLLEGLLLLNEIEGLRRFVLVRRTLAVALSQTDGTNTTIGRRLCEALYRMIGEVPDLVANCSREGKYNMERDTRRAIACLNFLGSLDVGFL